MAEDEHDYKVGPGRPPLHTRFKKGQSGNPGGRRKKNLPALLAKALDEKVYVTIDGERRQITKREAVVHQLVDKSTTADLRATKKLFDMMKDAEEKAGGAAPPPEPRSLDAADKEVLRGFVERIRQQVLAEMAEKKGETAGDCPSPEPFPRERDEGGTADPRTLVIVRNFNASIGQSAVRGCSGGHSLQAGEAAAGPGHRYVLGSLQTRIYDPLGNLRKADDQRAYGPATNSR